MSEFQYYRFEKQDGLLTRAQQSELETISSHAEITATQYSVEYHWGDFKGEPLALMREFFDTGFYYAGWGDVNIFIKLPPHSIDTQILAAAADDVFSVHNSQSCQLLVFTIPEVEDYIDEGEAMALCDAIYQLREELLQGDYRLIYLAWLYRLWFWEKATQLPLINFDFTTLSAPQKQYARVFELPDEYIRALALLLEKQPSHAIPNRPSDNEAMVSRLSDADKDKILLELFESGQVTRSFAISLLSQSSAPDTFAIEHWLTTETLASYLDEAKQLVTREKAEAAAIKQKMQQIETEKKLRRTFNNRESMWQNAHGEAETGSGHSYNRAFDLVQKLAEAYLFQDEKAAFITCYDEFVKRHRGRPALMTRLKKLKLV